MNLNLKSTISNAANAIEAWPVLNAIQAPLTFRDGAYNKPVIYRGTGELGDGYENHTVYIADARPIVDRLSLDNEGFELWPHDTAVSNFYDDDEVRKVYYPEVDQLVKAATGATRVVIFDHTVRIEDQAQRDERAVRGPVQLVHNDYTERSGPRRVHDLLDGMDRETFLRHRFAIVNVWRSIDAPIETTPIAVADSQSIVPEDFVATDLVRPDRTGEVYHVTYNPSHRWFYFSKMRRDEALLLKCYDSATDGRARFSAHSAFDDPTARENAPLRKSIEVRTLISFAP